MTGEIMDNSMPCTELRCDHTLPSRIPTSSHTTGDDRPEEHERLKNQQYDQERGRQKQERLDQQDKIASQKPPPNKQQQQQQQPLQQQEQRGWNHLYDLNDAGDNGSVDRNLHSSDDDDDVDLDVDPYHEDNGYQDQPTEEQLLEHMMRTSSSASSSTTLDDRSSGTRTNHWYNCQQYTDPYQPHHNPNSNAAPNNHDRTHHIVGSFDNSYRSYQSTGETTSESESSTISTHSTTVSSVRKRTRKHSSARMNNSNINVTNGSPSREQSSHAGAVAPTISSSNTGSLKSNLLECNGTLNRSNDNESNFEHRRLKNRDDLQTRLYDDAITSNTIKLLETVRLRKQSAKSRSGQKQQLATTTGPISTNIGNDIPIENAKQQHQHPKDSDTSNVLSNDHSVESTVDDRDGEVDGISMNKGSPRQRRAGRRRQLLQSNDPPPSSMSCTSETLPAQDLRQIQQQLMIVASASSKSSRSVMSESSVDDLMQEAFTHLKTRAQRLHETKQKTLELLEVSSSYPKEDQRKLIEGLITASTRRKLVDKLKRISSRTLSSERSHDSSDNISSKEELSQHVPDTGQGDLKYNDDDNIEKGDDKERENSGYDEDDDVDLGDMMLDRGIDVNKLLTNSPPLTPCGETITDHLVREALAELQRSHSSCRDSIVNGESQQSMHLQQEQSGELLSDCQTKSLGHHVAEENESLRSSNLVDYSRSSMLPPEYYRNDNSCNVKDPQQNQGQPSTKQQRERTESMEGASVHSQDIIFVPSDNEDDDDDDENDEKYDSFAVASQDHREGKIDESNLPNDTTKLIKKPFISASVFQIDGGNNYSSDSIRATRRTSMASNDSCDSQDDHRTKGSHVSESSSNGTSNCASIGTSVSRRSRRRTRSSASRSSFTEYPKAFVADSSVTSASQATTTVATNDAIVPSGEMSSTSSNAPPGSEGTGDDVLNTAPAVGNIDQQEICFVPDAEEYTGDATSATTLRLRQVLSETQPTFDPATQKRRKRVDMKQLIRRSPSKTLARSKVQQRGGLRDWLSNTSKAKLDVAEEQVGNMLSSKSFLFRSSRQQPRQPPLPEVSASSPSSPHSPMSKKSSIRQQQADAVPPPSDHNSSPLRISSTRKMNIQKLKKEQSSLSYSTIKEEVVMPIRRKTVAGMGLSSRILSSTGKSTSGKKLKK